ncbi:MAG: transglycosylase domain-containing protein [Bacteroidaceae bacterium]|nr:transglycosylase domain-containing protein [Bacteroidaceae bacterium]
MRKKFFVFLWVCYILGIIVIGIIFHGIFTGAIGYMPQIEQLQNPVNKFATQVFSADGKQLGTWSYSSANRVFADFNELPPALVQALIATEDVRFYEHNGIDFLALIRAIVKRGILQQKSAGGGSTITQQLAKQLYSEKAANTQERLLQKPIEWVIALKLERFYTKEEIIGMYFNYFDFLHNAVGIKTAAQTYFGKEPMAMDTCQCALLVGMCKNPSLYNPVRYPERCIERRNIVLMQMEKAGFLTKEQREELRERPLGLNFHRVSHSEGHATYLRDHLRLMLMAKKPVRSDYPSWQNQKFYEDSLAWEQDPLYGWCNKNMNRDGRPYNIYTDGLKVFTTLDSRMQEYAEEAVAKHVTGELQPLFDKEQSKNKNAPYASAISADKARADLARAKRQCARYLEMKRAGYSEAEIDDAFSKPIEMTVYTLHGDKDTIMSPIDSIRYYKSFLRTGFMCMDSETGHVKAYIGGVDYSHFQYDMCTQGKRQVGSTIKPYLYSLAMENGWTPCDVAPNVQQSYVVAGNQLWTPRNGSRSRYGEMVTLKWGLAMSNNWISAWLLSQLSPDLFVKLLHDFGIQNRDIFPSLALCLGPCDISVAEMVGAYSAFPQKGVRRNPLYVTRIEDNDGNVLAQFQSRVKEVISEEAAYKMIVMMRGVIDGGTGSRMRNRYKITAPMGGKTGTTNDNSDGWFVGYTPRLVFGAWVGGDERDVHFASMALGQGANSALPIAAYFLQKVYADERLGYSQTESFDIPSYFDPCKSVIDEDEGSSEGEEELVGFDVEE